jgi:hypothetical protein
MSEILRLHDEISALKQAMRSNSARGQQLLNEQLSLEIRQKNQQIMKMQNDAESKRRAAAKLEAAADAKKEAKMRKEAIAAAELERERAEKQAEIDRAFAEELAKANALRDIELEKARVLRDAELQAEKERKDRERKEARDRFNASLAAAKAALGGPAPQSAPIVAPVPEEASPITESVEATVREPVVPFVRTPEPIVPFVRTPKAVGPEPFAPFVRTPKAVGPEPFAPFVRTPEPIVPFVRTPRESRVPEVADRRSPSPMRFGPSTFHVAPDGIVTFKRGGTMQLIKSRATAEAMMPRQRSGMCYVHSVYNAVLNNPVLYDALVAQLKSRTAKLSHYKDLAADEGSLYGTKETHDVDALVRAIMVEKDKDAFQWVRDVISLTTLLAAPSLSKQQRAELRSNKADAARLITTVSLSEIGRKQRSTGTPKVGTFNDAESFAKWGDGGNKIDALISFLQMSGLKVENLQRNMSGNYDEYMVTLLDGMYALVRKRMNSCVGEGLHGFDTSGIIGETLPSRGQHATCYYRVTDDDIAVLDSNWTEGAAMTPVCAMTRGGGVGPRPHEVPVDDYISIMVGHRLQKGGDYGVDIDDDLDYGDDAAVEFELDDLDMLDTLEEDIDVLEVLPKLDVERAGLSDEQEDTYELATSALEKLLSMEHDASMEGGGSTNWGVAAALLGVTIATALFG